MVTLKELNRGAVAWLREQAEEMGFADMWEYRSWLSDLGMTYIDELRASPGE